MKRETVRLSTSDVSFLDALRDHTNAEFRALTELVDIEPGCSKAALLHAVVTVGVNEIRGRVREEGYQALLDSYSDEELAKQHAHTMSRRALRP